MPCSDYYFLNLLFCISFCEFVLVLGDTILEMMFPSQGTVKSHLQFSGSIILESNTDGHKMNGVGLFLREQACCTLLPGNHSSRL